MGRTKLLFLTVSEHGEANSVLAVLSAVRARPDGDTYELHLASYASLRARVPRGVTFHELPGQGMGDFFRARLAARPDDARALMHRVSTRPGFWPTIAAVRRLVSTVTASTPPDAPNTLKEVAGADQGVGAFVWPAVNTGYVYPLSFAQKLLNALVLLFIPLHVLIFDTTYKRLQRARRGAGYAGPALFMAPRTAPVLCMSTPGAEYPAVVPSDVVACGPILLPARAIADVDAELDAWLKQGPTVLVSLGSHWRLTLEQAREVRAALDALLETRKGVQVLWKLQLLGEDRVPSSDRLRVVDWLEADPAAIVRHENAVCSVSHGGSNSYHEALAAGKPQIILSVWYDTHDFGARAEWLGVGKWGNKRTAPFASAPDLTAALLAVVGRTPDAPDARRTAARAREVADIVMHRAAPGDAGREGRDVAADYVVDFVSRAIAERAAA
ncbi:hypothetical protein Q5752_004308 [Cryptotrichosporon argae]